jgi:Undecaprenyl-phosphate glucose phosphotransferase
VQASRVFTKGLLIFSQRSMILPVSDVRTLAVSRVDTTIGRGIGLPARREEKGATAMLERIEGAASPAPSVGQRDADAAAAALPRRAAPGRTVGTPPVPHALLAVGFVGLDALLLAVTALAAALLAGPAPGGLEGPIALLAGLLTLGGIGFAGCYRKGAFHDPARQIQPILLAGLGAGAIIWLSSIVFGQQARINHQWTLYWAGLAGIALPAGRALAARALLARPETFAERTIVIGGGTNGARLVQFLRRRHDRSLRLLGFVDDRYTRIGTEMDSLPFLGQIDEVFSLVRRGVVDQVIIALPWSAEERTLALLHHLSEYPVHVRLAPDLISYHFPGRSVTDVGGVPLVHLMDRPISGWSSVLKRAEDLAIAIPVLLVAAVPMALVALAIKLDSPGPVFFRQRRVGFNNREFRMMKFRSMRHNPKEEQRIARQATRDDPRITRIGAFLRKTSLDELPQIFNVLKGEMSIVGPRPHAPGTRAAGRPFEDVVARYAARHRVKPGLTGLAQVRGFRGETDTEDKIVRRVECDLEYIENWSVWLDVGILARTAMMVLRMKNAY